MSLTVSELSFLRLLERTKKLAREDLAANVWKKSAEEKLSQLDLIPRRFPDTGIEMRTGQSMTASSDDLMKQEEKQENIANELLSLTRSLKQNMTVAGNVLKDDNKVRL
ncbi:hypothetical protein COOONC_14559 [Cooperia oncophora]